MHKLRFSDTKFKKGVYEDGHERGDVVSYRNDVFLPEMEYWERSMSTFGRDDGSTDDPMMENRPNFLPGQKHVVFVNQDESTFYANDGVRCRWQEKDNRAIREKSLGLSLMCSDIIYPCHSPLYKPTETGEKLYAREFLEAGKNRDGFLDNEGLIRQLK